MKYLGWIIIFFIIVFIIPLSSRPMLSPQEFVQAETAREMLTEGSYTIPTLLGTTETIPMPMKYWLTAGSFKLFGINAFAARLPSALAVGLTALLISWFIHQSTRDEKLAALSSMLYMLFSITVLLGGSANCFAIFTLFASGAMGTLFLAAQEERFNRRKSLLLILSGLSAGAAFLTGGITGLLLPALICSGYLLFNGKYKDLLLLPLPWLLCAAIAVAPWVYCFADLQPENCLKFFSWATFTASIGTYTPWYSRFIWFILGLCPAAVLLPAALMAGKESWQRLLKNHICRFALLAVAVPPVYLAAMRSTPPAMVLIAFPAMAILLAMGLQAYFNSGGHHRSFDWMLNIWGLLLLIVGIISAAAWFMQDNVLKGYFDSLPITRLFLINLGVSAIIGGGVVLYSLRGNWRSRLYLFFFSAALLPLSISWCFSTNTAIPGAELRKLINDMDIVTDNSVFVTRADFAPALAWCTENQRIIILKEGETFRCISEKPVYAVLLNDDRAWGTLPQGKTIVGKTFSCAEIKVTGRSSQK